jgi:hypothetical protein
MSLSTQPTVRFFIWGQTSWHFLAAKIKKKDSKLGLLEATASGWKRANRMTW